MYSANSSFRPHQRPSLLRRQIQRLILTGAAVVWMASHIVVAQEATQANLPPKDTTQAESKPGQTDELSGEWKPFDVPETKVRLEFPDTPSKRERMIKPTGKKQTKIVGYRYLARQGKLLFSFHRSELENAMDSNSARLKALEWAEKNTIATVLAGKSKSSKRIRYGRNLGQEFRYEFIYTDRQRKSTTAWTGVTANYIVGQEFYELTVLQHTDQFDEAIARRFLKSFQLKNDSKK